MIDQGATTMWERWDGFVRGRGFQDKSMNSFNHYSIGSVGEWFYRSILGINLDPKIPGYKHCVIHPKFGKGQYSLHWVKGNYDSIYGKIQVEWFKDDDTFILDVSIPVNTEATIFIPVNDDQRFKDIMESGLPVSNSDIIKMIKIEQNRAILKIQSGTYHFEV
jgi:alpha-L-rhamnosidase